MDRPLDTDEIRIFIAELEAIANREGEPPNFRRIARSAADRLTEALEEREAGRLERAADIVLGTANPDGKRSADGIVTILPRWARGQKVLDRLAGVVVVDEGPQPPTVTVHWERVPRELRAEAASLASELVDVYYGRPTGGRPRRKKIEDKTG